MTRSVKDLRELICVSRLTMRESDEEGSDDDLSRPLSSLSIFGEASASRSSSDITEALNGLSVAARPPYEGKVVRPRSQQGTGARRKQPTPTSRINNNNNSSIEFQNFKTPLPPLESRPSSGGSEDSNRPGSGEVKGQDSGNFDDVLQYVDSDVIVDWLGRANEMVTSLTSWCNGGDNFVKFANFWLTEFLEAQRMELIHMEVGILHDELGMLFDKGLKQGKVTVTDLNRLVLAILREYPGRLCSARGTYVFLNILETLSSERTEDYKKLLTDVRISTRNRDFAQWMLAIRAFLLLSVWSNIVNFYRRFKSDDPQSGSTESPAPGEDRLSADGVQAVRHGFVSVLHYLVKNKKLDLASVDEHDRSLVFEAVMHNQPKVLHYLLKKACPGLDVNHPCSTGNTPLHAAANWGYTEVVQILLDKGQALVNCTNPKCDDATPLHLAVMQGHTAACELLLEAGADTAASMTNGITPRQLAQDMGHGNILFLLARHQGDDDQEEEEEEMDS